MIADVKLYKRKSGKRTIYYARLFDESGTLVKTVSTGKTNHYQAHDWIKGNLPALNPERRDPTFAEFTTDFYVWGKCTYVARQNAKDRSMAKVTADGRRRHLDYYLLPKFGNVKLRDITAPAVEKWLLTLKAVKLKKGEIADLSNSAKNQILYTLNIVLREAKREGFLKTVPELEPFGTKRKKHRQPLTDNQMIKLFPLERNEFIDVWDDFETGVMFETILSTGARSGEACGWWKSDVLIEAKAIKIFRQLYREGEYGLPGRQRNPDKDPRRITLLPDRTLHDIVELIGPPPYPDEPLFTYDGKPWRQYYVLKRLKRAARNAGVGDIDAHTLRYTYASKMRELMISADVPDAVLQLLLGHKNEAVTNIYDPFMLERAIKKAIPSRPAIDEFWRVEKEVTRNT